MHSHNRSVLLQNCKVISDIFPCFLSRRLCKATVASKKLKVPVGIFTTACKPRRPMTTCIHATTTRRQPQQQQQQQQQQQRWTPKWRSSCIGSRYDIGIIMTRRLPRAAWKTIMYLSYRLSTGNCTGRSNDDDAGGMRRSSRV